MIKLQRMMAALTLSLLACNALTSPLPPTPPAVWPLPIISPVATVTDTEPPPPTDTPTSAPTESPAPIVSATPFGYCAPPVDDYSRLEVRGETINNRTYQMLLAAQQIYLGPADLLWVTQGSYSESTAASFGTHAGGGAVDLSIRNPQNFDEILDDEAEPMVIALRWAGFAAWYRYPGSLGAGSAPHIHAIAVGDTELSPAAIDQLTGPGGYFRGLDGLPDPLGPNPDPHSGPVICDWMLALGYKDLR